MVDWILAFGKPSSVSTSRIDPSVALPDWNTTSTRVPLLKSRPRFRPLMPMNAEPMASGTNEIASHMRHLPTKSNFHRGSRAVRPISLSFWKTLVPAIISMTTRVTTTAVKSEMSTPTISVNAKPLGPAVLNRKRIAAVRNVTTFASMMALMPFEYPVSTADLAFLPARASSRIRSKITTFASAATPMVRMAPAIPGRVRVIGTSTATAR